MKSFSLTLQNIEHLKRQIKSLDKVISRELKAIPQTLTAVKGLGEVSASGIIAEIGDIKRFKNEASPGSGISRAILMLKSVV